MSSFRYCSSCKELHDVAAWPPLCMSAPPKRSHLPAPMLIRDGMEPVRSMLDGQMYDSKSTLRRTYRQAGVIEVGNEKQKPPARPKPDRKAISASVEKGLSRAGFGA